MEIRYKWLTGAFQMFIDAIFQGLIKKMISIQKRDNCTIFRVTGEVTANEIAMQAAQFIAGDPTETSLWDFTGTTRLKITTLELKGIADSLKRISPKAKARKVALVGSKSINIGLGKLFAAFAQMAGLPSKYKVFRDMDHAMQWLQNASL